MRNRFQEIHVCFPCLDVIRSPKLFSGDLKGLR